LGLKSVRDIRGTGPERSRRNPNSTTNFHLCFGIACFNVPIEGGDGQGVSRLSFEPSFGVGFSVCDYDPFDPCEGAGGLGGTSGKGGVGVTVSEDGGVCLLLGPILGVPGPTLDAGEMPSASDGGIYR
jgi:hypothetical protein